MSITCCFLFKSMPLNTISGSKKCTNGQVNDGFDALCDESSEVNKKTVVLGISFHSMYKFLFGNFIFNLNKKLFRCFELFYVYTYPYTFKTNT